jgi:hypothetical protein
MSTCRQFRGGARAAGMDAGSRRWPSTIQEDNEPITGPRPSLARPAAARPHSGAQHASAIAPWLTQGYPR